MSETFLQGCSAYFLLEDYNGCTWFVVIKCVLIILAGEAVDGPECWLHHRFVLDFPAYSELGASAIMILQLLYHADFPGAEQSVVGHESGVPSLFCRPEPLSCFSCIIPDLRSQAAKEQQHCSGGAFQADEKWFVFTDIFDGVDGKIPR